jgi:hypothetical protein
MSEAPNKENPSLGACRPAFGGGRPAQGRRRQTPCASPWQSTFHARFHAPGATQRTQAMRMPLSRFEPRSLTTLTTHCRYRKAQRSARPVARRPPPPRIDPPAPSRSADNAPTRIPGRESRRISRSASGTKTERTPSSVVLPDPVPPDTTMFARPLTQAEGNRSIRGPIDPCVTRSAGAGARRELANRQGRTAERKGRNDRMGSRPPRGRRTPRWPFHYPGPVAVKSAADRRQRPPTSETGPGRT